MERDTFSKLNVNLPLNEVVVLMQGFASHACSENRCEFEFSHAPAETSFRMCEWLYAFGGKHREGP
jgi:hypothetical protein